MITDEVLQKIREKYSHYPEDKKLNKNTAVYHIRLLLGEVEQLREK